MKWHDLETGKATKEFLCQFIATISKDFLVFLAKSNPSLQKEFAGFRPEHLSKERLSSKIAPHFNKDELLREVILREWSYYHKELVSSLERFSVSRLDKEIPSLIKKHGFMAVYSGLLFDFRKGTDKLVARLERETRQQKLWTEAPRTDEFSAEGMKLFEEARKRVEELEEQRERICLEIEREKDSRAKLEDLYFSLKKENKDQKKQLEELETKFREVSQRSQSFQNQESKSSEYLSEIHALQKHKEKIEYDLQREKQFKEEAEMKSQNQQREIEKLKNDLLFSRDQIDLLQAVLLLQEREEKRPSPLSGGMITLVCGQENVPSSFFKLASSKGMSLLLHSSRTRDQKLEDYISRSQCVLLCGGQFPEGLRGIVQSLCFSRKVRCYQLPFLKEKIFDDVLNALCFIGARA